MFLNMIMFIKQKIINHTKWGGGGGGVKQINIKHRTYYFYSNIKNVKPNLLKIYRKSYKSIGIYNIGYITIKKKKDDCENILYLLVNHASGYIEEKIGKQTVTKKIQ